MAELNLKLTVKKGWLLRAGLPGAFVVLCLMRVGAPASWFMSVDAS